ncbi:ATP-dependent RNA helicase DDX42-like [Oppia nitens]|uniref:ATP-dependent RNA helicase DDX42-like n=1 Tax=Oppia nitens TaxID=1686743 RepID=UPI0023DCE4E0|nr:ATP-dependent RNA helicase DDX42-like [Oppia nitens]
MDYMDSDNRRDFRTVPPPENINKRQSYSKCTDIPTESKTFGFNYVNRRQRHRTDDDYFEDDENPDENPDEQQTPYQPNPGSPLLNTDCNDNNNDEDDEEEDPLDAFMAGLEKQTKEPNKPSKSMPSMSSMANKLKTDKLSKMKGIRDDIEKEDEEESYYRYMEENPMAGVGTFVANSDDEDADDIEYDTEGNPIGNFKSKMIDPLPPIYHSEIIYSSFEKNFYVEHEDIAKLSITECNDLRQKLGIKVSGLLPPKPVASFGHFGFDDQLLKTIRKLEYTQPTPIQAQAVPAALNGRDIIGIAKTGSGKTAAFIWPLLVHIMDQPDLKPGDGPIGLILAPTRELAQQIYTEAKRFGKVYGINIVCAYGGGNKYEQSKDLENGAEIIVATPGRLIDLIKSKSTNLLRVTFLVLDEADRMFDMGFEPQVRSISNHVRPDRQTLMFSATFKKRVEKLARDILIDPIRIVQGEVGEANEDITQVMIVFDSGPKKWEWLTSKIVEFTTQGSVLIFVTKKANAEELATNLKTHDMEVVLLHGDMNQIERNKVITEFKRKQVSILVATDVAARGLDITHVKTVVNYDMARDIDTHTHRIGRTGRAGEKGVAYTLVTDKDTEFAGHLVRNLEGANQLVPDKLLALAMQSQWFKKSRFRGKNAKKLNVGGVGLGFKSRPRLGLGAQSSALNYDKCNTYSSSIISSSTPTTSSLQTNSQSNRVNVMKSAFSAQYKSNFTAATDTQWKSNMSSDEKPKKKSRWN